MACRLYDTKPLAEPLLDYYQLDPWEQSSVKILLKYKIALENIVCEMAAIISGGLLIKKTLKYLKWISILKIILKMLPVITHLSSKCNSLIIFLTTSTYPIIKCITYVSFTKTPLNQRTLAMLCRVLELRQKWFNASVLSFVPLSYIFSELSKYW